MKLLLTGITDPINVTDATTPNTLVVECASIYEVDALREQLTDEALSHFEFLDSVSNVAGRYDNYTFTGNVSYTVADNIYTARYSIRQKTDTEIRLDKLEAGQEAQDVTIDNLAQKAGVEYSAKSISGGK